jgi:hypothetical protein
MGLREVGDEKDGAGCMPGVQVGDASRSMPGEGSDGCDEPRSMPGGGCDGCDEPRSIPGGGSDGCDEPRSMPGGGCDGCDEPRSMPGGGCDGCDEPRSMPGGGCDWSVPVKINDACDTSGLLNSRSESRQNLLGRGVPLLSEATLSLKNEGGGGRGGFNSREDLSMTIQVLQSTITHLVLRVLPLGGYELPFALWARRKT